MEIIIGEKLDGFEMRQLMAYRNNALTEIISISAYFTECFGHKTAIDSLENKETVM